MENRTLRASLVYAWQGISYALRTQRNMRIHLAAGIAVVAAGAGLGLHGLEWLFLSSAVALVLLTELLNTGIEVLVDFLTREHHADAKVIKDLAAAAVLASVVYAIIVGCVVLLPRLASLLPLHTSP